MRKLGVLLLLACVGVFTACSDGGNPVVQTTPIKPPVSVPLSPPVRLSSYTSGVDFDLTGSASISSASISIVNNGASSLTMPAVFLNGDAGLNRSSVLDFIQKNGPLADQDFALAVWTFVTQHTTHYCIAGAPGDTNNFALEPMRLMHGFGFTCCDQSSRILAWLWQGAGYPSRVATMAFHTVPEIYYQGAWHMYDGDHRVYYLASDDKTVASLAQIIADPTLVSRVADSNGNDPVGYSADWMASQYAASIPSYQTIDYTRTGTYSLLPGQTFMLRSQNIFNNVFYGNIAGNPALQPSDVTSAQFDWGLDFANANWNVLAFSHDGLSTVSNGGSTYLTNSGSAAGTVVYSLSSPFPLFSLTVSGLTYRADDTAAINAYFSTDGSKWSNAFPLNSDAGISATTSADLSVSALGQYSYYVKLEMSGSANAARIANVHITSDVQAANILFPKLLPGAVNHLTYQDWSPTGIDRNVSVSLAVQ